MERRCYGIAHDPYGARTSDEIIITVVRRKPDVSLIVVPSQVMRQTRDALLSAGRSKREGLVYWPGRAEGTVAIITSAKVPRCRSGCCDAEPLPEDLRRIREELKDHDEYLFAQVHSHPGAAFHSRADRLGGISLTVGFLSVVVPQFGNVPFENLDRCAVFCHVGGARWQRLSSIQVRTLFRFS